METGQEKRSSLCIFCLKITDDSPDDSVNTSKSDKLRFFSLIIQHFLNSALHSADNQEWCRNACKVISETTDNSDDVQPVIENVQICSNCEGITREFSDLYNQMKELELRVDWEVGKLWNAIRCADKVATRLEKEQLENTSTSVGGGVTLGTFRNALKQSCQAYQEIKKTIVEDNPLNGRKEKECIPDLLSPMSFEDGRIEHPQVLEYPYHIQPEVQDFHVQLEVDNQRESLTKELVVEHDDEQKMDVEFPVHPMVINDLSSLALSSLPTAPVFILQEEDPLHPPTNSQSTYICTTSTCSLPFTSKFELFQHNMANHIEKYFSSVQLSTLSNDQFNKYITLLLETTLDTFDKVDEKYKCPLCSVLFPERQKARNHLVVKHRSTLKEKLEEIQKSESDPAKTPEEMESSINTTDDITSTTLKRKRGWPKGKSRNFKPKLLNSDLYCAHCSQSFFNKHKLFQHDMHYHPGKYFISVKLEWMTQHQFQNCVDHILSTTADEFQKVDSKYRCNFCNTYLSFKKSGRYHLVAKHQSVVREKLIELQNSSNINMIMDTSRRTIRKPSLSARHNGKFHHICNICEKEFKWNASINPHQSYCHPEIFFENSNLLPSSSENNEEFKNIVRYVLEQQMKFLVQKKGDQVKCGICSNVLGNRYHARSHLISKHRVILAEKLKDAQKRGTPLHEVEDERLKIKGKPIVEKLSPQTTGSDFRAALVEPQKSGSVPLADSNTVCTSLQRMRNNDQSHPVCNICGKLYTNGYVLNRHQTEHHPEIFFQAEKSTQLQLDSEGDQLFRKYVRYMLEKQVDPELTKITVATLAEVDRLEEPPGGGENIKYKCNFCPNASCSRKFAITHLIVMHQRNMADEILGGLSGKTVEEIKLEMMRYETERPDNEGRKSSLSFDCFDAVTTATPLKRKGGWPKGKKRLFKKPLLDCNVESCNVPLKTQGDRDRSREN